MTRQLLGATFVHGLPSPFASSGELRWKEVVADAIHEAWGDRSFIEQRCEMLLEFHMPPHKVTETDIDNLLKPSIDAVASVLFKPARSGRQTRWNADDHWIYKLVAEKFSAPTDDRIGMLVTVNEWRGEADV